MSPIAKYLMISGGIVFLAGVIWFFFGNKLHWLGRLPGDIRIEKENFRLYFPITTMILLSIILTIVINLVRKIF
jgi:Na+-driven multidrug efflux pump